jgi:hypothetical protein
MIAQSSADARSTCWGMAVSLFAAGSAAGSAARAGIPKTIAAVAPNLNAIPAAGARIIGFMGQNMSAWQMSNISKATIAIRTVTILSRHRKKRNIL